MKTRSLWLILQRMRTPFLVIIITYTISIIGLLLIDGIDSEGRPYHLSIFDAFYFISYTATTIGFGETPFTFTYPQRIWVSITVFFTVTGWFYSIGTLVALLQDKLFLEELARAKFKRDIAYLKEKYIILLGYNFITSEIIKKANELNLRSVVIEKDEQKRNHLLLENFTPPVYCLNADAHHPQALEAAGIRSNYCQAIVSLFENDALNLRIALTSKVLNPNILMAIKATTKNQSENLQDVGVQIIENPFEIIANHIHLAINAPHSLRLIRWLYGLCNLYDPLLQLPHGKYLICGYGRMGKSIDEVLQKNGFETAFAEIDPQQKTLHVTPSPNVIIGDGDDKEMLKALGIDACVAIIAGTNDDTTNLSILATAKKLNPKIITIARENELEDFSIFESSKIDAVFIPAKVLINKTVHAILNPSLDLFIRQIYTLEESKIMALTKSLLEIDMHPLLFSLKIDPQYTPMLLAETSRPIHLSLLRTSLKNRHLTNHLIPLMHIRHKQITVLPSWDILLEKNDLLLFAGDHNAKEQLELIAQNYYEFHYAQEGKEKGFFGSLRENKRSLKD